MARSSAAGTILTVGILVFVAYYLLTRLKSASPAAAAGATQGNALAKALQSLSNSLRSGSGGKSSSGLPGGGGGGLGSSSKGSSSNTGGVSGSPIVSVDPNAGNSEAVSLNQIQQANNSDPALTPNFDLGPAAQPDLSGLFAGLSGPPALAPQPDNNSSSTPPGAIDLSGIDFSGGVDIGGSAGGDIGFSPEFV
ncbi:MAG TPA: hypothetical protein VKW06_07870 [Candidatus Angelobacter sp.]|nr:hypothetical protein [Candidatus Angelobacter sp.]